MIINFICWSPLISFIAIALLYPLKNHVRGFYITRIYASALLLPALVASICGIKLILIDKITINKISQVLAPVFLGHHITATNSLITLCAVLSLTFLAMFLPQKYYSENLSLFSVFLGAISLIAYAADYQVKFAVLCIAAAATTYSAPYDSSKLTKDFLLQRLLDIIGFFCLIIILSGQNLLVFNQNQDNNTVKLIFILSLLFQALLVICPLIKQTGSHNSKQFHAIRWLILGVGSSIIISQFQSPIELWPFILMILLTVAAFILNSLRHKKLGDIILPFTVIFALVNSEISTALICISILGYPYFFLTQKYEEQPQKLSLKASSRLASLFKTFGSFLTIAYSGFLLYRLPQIIMSILQTPLRLSHNGNIQRSLMLTAIVLISCIFWWQK